MQAVNDQTDHMRKTAVHHQQQHSASHDAHLSHDHRHVAFDPSAPLLASEDSKEHGSSYHAHPSSHAHRPALHITPKPTPGSISSRYTSPFAAFLDRYFHISARSSSIATEIRAGVVTFATMAYILIVNAEILSRAQTPGQPGMQYDGIVFATAISAAVGSAMVGLWGNLPFGLAAGMGLNSYFTYAVVIQLKLSFQVALTASFLHGVLFTLLSLAGACNLIQQWAPESIKKSITVGLGLFQALIGFESMKLIVQGKDTLLELGDITSVRLWLSLMGLLLISILLLWKVKAAMLIGMAVVTAVVWGSGLEPPPATFIEWPSLGNSWLALDFAGYWANAASMVPVTLMFLFVSVFDTAGVQATAARQADLLNAKGHLAEKESTAAFASASVATCVGALLGSSPTIIHTECCAGIGDGARTGLHSVVVAVLFLLFLPFVPVLHAVPSLVTAPALVIVGCAMMGVSRFIDWENGSEALPAFLTSTLIAFSYSIANGVIAGLVAYAVLKLAALVAGGEPVVEEQAPPSLERRKSGSMLAYVDSPRETPTKKAHYGTLGDERPTSVR